MVFVEIYAKNVKFGSAPPFREVRVTHDFGWWLIGKLLVDSLFALIELFSLSIRIPELWGEIYTARLFSQRGQLLCTHILPRQGRPPTIILGVRKTRATGLPDGEDHIPLCFLVLTQYRSVTDRQTDGRICRSIYNACKASFTAHCKS